jgi:hypothetical protein
MRTLWTITALAIVLALAPAPVAAKKSKLSAEQIAVLDDDALCDVVNSTRRSSLAVDELRRRAVPCDSIATHCLRQGLEDGTAPFQACVSEIERRWAAQREAVDRERMRREMMRQGDPMRNPRPTRTICRVVAGPDGQPRQVCTVQ